MNIMPRRKKTTTALSDWNASSALITGLQEQADVFRKELIAEEGRARSDVDDKLPTAEQIEVHAQVVLDGVEIPVPPKNQPQRLLLLRTAYAACLRAIDLAREQQMLIAVRHGLDQKQQRAAEWRENVHETVLTVCRLQALNRRRLALAKEIRGKASTLVLPCEFPNNAGILLGLGLQGGGPAHEFLRVAILEGFTTAGEIARERGDDERALKDAFGI